MDIYQLVIQTGIHQSKFNQKTLYNLVTPTPKRAGPFTPQSSYIK